MGDWDENFGEEAVLICGKIRLISLLIQEEYLGGMHHFILKSPISGSTEIM